MGINTKINRKSFLTGCLSDDWYLKSTIKWLLFIFCAFILQTKILVFGYHLNLIILVVYAFIIHTVRRTTKKEEFRRAEWEIKCTTFGGFIGILDDIVSASIIGPSFLSKALIGFFGAVLFGNILFRWTLVLGFIVIFFLTIFDGLTQLIVRIILSDFRIGIYSVTQMILLQALINIPLSILFQPDESK